MRKPFALCRNKKRPNYLLIVQFYGVVLVGIENLVKDVISEGNIFLNLQLMGLTLS